MNNLQTKQMKRNIINLEDMLFDSFFKSPTGSMKTDIKETETSYVLEVELPGFDKKDVNISFEDGYLMVSATKKYEQVENEKYIKRESFIGTCSRSYYVGEVDKEKIDASYKDGILYIDVPKEEKKPEEAKFIQIK